MAKYGNRFTFCLQGHEHDSKLEADMCNYLWAMVKDNDILAYDVQKKVQLLGKRGNLICIHEVDFHITPSIPGLSVVLDSKGKSTKDWAIKAKLFMDSHPGIPYILQTKKAYYHLALGQGVLKKKRIDFDQFIREFKDNEKS